MSRTALFALLTLLLPLSVPAADDAAPDKAPVPAPPPLAEEEEQIIRPEVTITREPERVVEEYRINGRLYMVRVYPRKGKPYYLLYPEQGGNPVRGELDDIQTPYWKLFEW